MALQASSKVKGITIEIGADTSKFGYEMSQIRKEAQLITKDMKSVDEAMKLDPTNVGKAADKLKLLREQADNATKKVNTIKAAIDALNKEYQDQSSKEYTEQLEHLERQLESATREQEVANARLKEFENNAGSAKVEVMDLGKMIEAHLVSNSVSFFLNNVSQLVRNIIGEIKELSKALVDFSVDSVKSAAAFNDAIGYSEVVFGNMSEDSLQWAKDNSEGLRISQRTLTEYMNTLGQVFHSQGLAEDDALDKVESLMELAADLRAATGKTTDEILPVMQRGFTTSVKNFRQFGVIMTDAEVKAYALAHGLAEVTVDETKLAKATADLHDAQQKAQDALNKYGEGSVELEKAEAKLITAEEKYNEVLEGEADNMDAATIITARYSLLMERLANIQGQNERESDLFNSQLALMQTKFENLKDTIGLELLPVATELLTSLNDFLSSEDGQQILSEIVKQFKEWGKSIDEMVKDGRFKEFLQNMIDNLPHIVESIGQIVDAVIRALPYIAQMTDEVLQLFGIKSENQQIKEAFIEVENQIDQFARNSGTDIDTMVQAIHAYAESNNKDVLDIYNNWSEYEPKIKGYIDDITTTADGSKQGLETALQGMSSVTTTSIESQISTWDRLKSALNEFCSFFNTNVLEIIGYLSGMGGSYVQGSLFTRWATSGISNLFSRASGGSAEVGQILRVNDDAGHRSEMFVPSVPGTILNGEQTDKVMNNYNNSKNFNGGINIYVTSTALSVDDLANDLGEAMNRKLRMSGAIL